MMRVGGMLTAGSNKTVRCRIAWHATALLLLACVTGSSGPARADAPACARSMAGWAPLRIDDGFITMQVSINGRPASMLVDTGSEGGLATPDAAAELQLRPDPAHRSRLRGTGGDGRTVRNVVMPGLELDGLTLPGASVPVEALPAMPVISPAVAGLVGADTLSRFDVEFDFRRHRIVFWLIRLGSVACAPPPAWDGAFGSIPLRLENGRPVLAVVLDGHPVTALLDSGARSRIVSIGAAARIGIGAGALGVDPGGINAGVDGHESTYHWHRFRSLVVGQERFMLPVLTVAPVAERFDLLLGADWFDGRDVWVSFATGTLFVRQ